MAAVDPDFRRFRTAVSAGTPDRVPLAEVLVDHEIKEAFLGRKVSGVEADLAFWIEAGYDYFLLGRRLLGFQPFWEQARADTYYDVQRLRSATPGWRGPVTNRQQFRQYPWMKAADIDFSILDRAEKHLPANIKIVRYLGPFFQLVWMLMGFEVFSYALRDERDLVAAMFEKIGGLLRAELDDALARDSVGAVWFLDDVGIKSGLMVAPDVLRRPLRCFCKAERRFCRNAAASVIGIQSSTGCPMTGMKERPS